MTSMSEPKPRPTNPDDPNPERGPGVPGIEETPDTTPRSPEVDPEPPVREPGIEEPVPTRERLEPTRYGDWEMNGKCVDF